MNDKLREEAKSELEMFGRFGAETCRELVKSWNNKTKHETVEQWEERTGETYPDDGPVWIYKEFKHNVNKPDNSGWDDNIWKYRKAMGELAFYTITKIYVANHQGNPDD